MNSKESKGSVYNYTNTWIYDIYKLHTVPAILGYAEFLKFTWGRIRYIQRGEHGDVIPF